MRLGRIRFSVRWLMIAVAVFAIILGIESEYFRTDRLKSKYLSTLTASMFYLDQEDWMHKYMSAGELRVARLWFSTMIRKYELASRAPRLPVDPDPATPPEVRRYIQLVHAHPHIIF